MTLSGILLQAAGWALLHFVWQGILIAFALIVALRCLRRCSANARYLASCAALALMFAAPLTTMYHLTRASASLMTRDGRLSSSPATNERAGAGALSSGEQSSLSSRLASAELLDRQAGNSLHWIEEQLNRLMPYLLLGWLSGVLILFVRLIGGWAWAQRLKHEAGPTLAGVAADT